MRKLLPLLLVACATQEPKPPPRTVKVQPPSAADDDNLFVTVNTGFHVTPRNPAEQESILGAILEGAQRARLECERSNGEKSGDGEALAMCSNLGEIIRRKMMRGNMELWIRRAKNGDVTAYLIGDGRGQTCRAIRAVRARLSESVATERVKLTDQNCP